jgi:ubiquinone/menaquinone biosynthesis C-methylase UbiE
MNASHMAFCTSSFDIALSGFMGWYDCFDFVNFKFTQPDTKAKEIWRVLRDGGRFVCCSWEQQEDVTWMEEAFIRHYPAILQDREFLDQRTIGMAFEKAEGYEIILPSAGFREIEIAKESMVFVSTDEEEWWRQMYELGWFIVMDKIDPAELQRIKEAVFQDLQPFKQADGIHFQKTVFFVRCVK